MQNGLTKRSKYLHLYILVNWARVIIINHTFVYGYLNRVGVYQVSVRFFRYFQLNFWASDCILLVYYFCHYYPFEIESFSFTNQNILSRQFPESFSNYQVL